jgi:hypothetical protein
MNSVKIIRELIDPEFLNMPGSRIFSSINGSIIQITVMFGFGENTEEHDFNIDLTDPESLPTLKDWIEETIGEAYF